MADISALLGQILDRLAKIERKVGVASSSSSDAERNPLAAAFEAEVVAGPGAALVAAARALGDDGAKLAASFEAQFASALRLLDMAGACKKPAPEVRGGCDRARARSSCGFSLQRRAQILLRWHDFCALRVLNRALRARDS